MIALIPPLDTPVNKAGIQGPSAPMWSGIRLFHGHGGRHMVTSHVCVAVLQPGGGGLLTVHYDPQLLEEVMNTNYAESEGRGPEPPDEHLPCPSPTSLGRAG